MKKITSLLVLIFVCSLWTHAQFNCKVMVEALQGQYNGDCKKGLANGEGSAKGVDTYVGSFKKGYPHGFGVYTFANGSTYIGNYRKGLKDGYGLLNTITEAGDRMQDYGLWLADSLMAPNDPKALFRVKNRKGIKVVDPKLNRDKSVKNQIWINFQIDGVTDKSVVVSKATISSGKQMDTRDRALDTLVAFEDIETFPVTFTLEYEIRKTNQFEAVECFAEITLFTAGLWEINLNH